MYIYNIGPATKYAGIHSTYTSTFTVFTRAVVLLSRKTVERKQQNVKQANTLNE